MAERRMILIGGGELKDRETLAIDEYIVSEAKRIAGDRRACGLFIPTASHDFMPYYNTFHKVYTGLFDIKTDVALTVHHVPDLEKLRKKFEKADFIYVGGGNTVFMMQHWQESGLYALIKEAYERGVLLTGLSAGAICWFEEMYSDSYIEDEYAMYPGFGWIKGKISPHYDQRMLDFDRIVLYNRYRAWGLENDAALELCNEQPIRSISGGGRVFVLDATSGTFQKTVF